MSISRFSLLLRSILSLWQESKSFGKFLQSIVKIITSRTFKRKWNPELTEIAPLNQELLDMICSRTAFTVHIFYIDMWPSIFDSIKSLPKNLTFLITVESQRGLQEIESDLSSIGVNYVVKLARNRGRNFGPLLVEFSKELLHFESFVHIHTKMSKHSKGLGNKWSDALFMPLLTQSTAVEQLLAKCELEPSVGIAYSYCADFIGHHNFAWNTNLKFANRIVRKSGVGFLPANDKPFPFPAGGMFWVRTSAVESLLALDWKYSDFPKETGQIDGTVQHAVERLFGFLPTYLGFDHLVFLPSKAAFTMKSDYLL